MQENNDELRPIGKLRPPINRHHVIPGQFHPQIALPLFKRRPRSGRPCTNARTPSGVIKFQQMPCTPTGGGETLPVKTIPAGSGSGLSESAKNYMVGLDQYWNEKAQAAAEESKRQEALSIERGKVRAAQEQAAAQRATALGVRATDGAKPPPSNSPDWALPRPASRPTRNSGCPPHPRLSPALIPRPDTGLYTH